MSTNAMTLAHNLGGHEGEEDMYASRGCRICYRANPSTASDQELGRFDSIEGVYPHGQRGMDPELDAIEDDYVDGTAMYGNHLGDAEGPEYRLADDPVVTNQFHDYDSER